MALIALMAGLHAHVKIRTIFSGVPPEHVTTGNGITNHLYWDALHLPAGEAPRVVPEETLLRFRKMLWLRDFFVLDFSNQDPRTFTPENDKYFFLASKRGQVFHLLATLFMGFVLWVYVMRIAYGDCGGYKSIIRKPPKQSRNTLHATILIGYLLFMGGFVYANYYMLRDREVSKVAGDSLAAHNREQLETFEASLNKLARINAEDVDVIYSEQSYERFRIGFFGRSPLRLYKRSFAQAQALSADLFKGSKNTIYLKSLVLLLGVHFLLLTFFYAYRNRKVLFALFLAVGLAVFMVFGIVTFGHIFNYFSVYVDVCDQTIKTFDPRRGPPELRRNHRFQELLTTLSPGQKQVLKTQINSVLTGQNTVLTILRNYFDNPSMGMKLERKLDSVAQVMRHYSEIADKINETSATKPELNKLLIKFLGYVKEIEEIFQGLNKLDSAQHLKDWAWEMNSTVCLDGLKYQYHILVAFLVVLLGLLIMIIGVYFSENVIRGLYNEEIMYVKTNKLRYDWN